MIRIIDNVLGWTLENFKEREAKLTLFQYAVAALLFLGVIDLETMDLVRDILNQVLLDAERVTEGATEIHAGGLNQVAGLALAHFASEGFKKSRGQAKSGRG